MSDIQIHIENIAKRLAATDRYGATSSVQIMAGVFVPRWVTYVSEATRIEREHNATE